MYSSTPTFSTYGGSLGSFDGGSSISVDIDATGDDSSAVTFALQSGSLPGGLSLNTSTGVSQEQKVLQQIQHITLQYEQQIVNHKQRIEHLVSQLMLKLMREAGLINDIHIYKERKQCR